MTNLVSILKSRDITLPTKVRLVKAMVFPVVMYGCESWTIKRRLSTAELMLLNCGVGEDSWESLGLARRSNQSILKEISPGCSLEGLMLKRNSNTLATWCEELTHLKRLWCWETLKAGGCWEGLGAGGEAEDRGWEGWMASLTQWTWVWVDSGSWWWTGRPGVLWFMGCKESDMTERLNWTELLVSAVVLSWYAASMLHNLRMDIPLFRSVFLLPYHCLYQH